jgi:hypothetical protein
MSERLRCQCGSIDFTDEDPSLAYETPRAMHWVDQPCESKPQPVAAEDRLRAAGTTLAGAADALFHQGPLAPNGTWEALRAAISAWEEATKPEGEPVVCPLCGVKNWDRKAAEVHAEFCASLRDATTKTKGD